MEEFFLIGDKFKRIENANYLKMVNDSRHFSGEGKPTPESELPRHARKGYEGIIKSRDGDTVVCERGYFHNIHNIQKIK